MVYLFKKDTKGKLRYLKVWSEGATIFNESGLIGTDSPVIHEKVAKPKNVGKSNETTAEEQAQSEVQSFITKKLKEGYFLTQEEASSEEILLPMLAKSYGDEAHKIDWSTAYCQTKLDGCFTYGSLVDTKIGLLPIGYIVDNKIQTDVKSYNFNTNTVEYKPIVNWFNNGKASEDEYIILKFDKGANITCTRNHRIYTDKGWKCAEDLLAGDKVKTLVPSYIFGAVLGTFLGDGNISKDKRIKRSYKLSFSHSKAQEKYGDYKATVLGYKYSKRNRVSGYGSDIIYYHIQGISELYNFIELLLDDSGNRKILDYKFLKRYLTTQGLAFWIGDDGSIRYNNGNKSTPVLSIHTEGYSEEQVDEFVKFFTLKYNCTPTKVKAKSKFFLVFNTKDTLLIFNYLRNFIPEGVEYKFPIKDENNFQKEETYKTFLNYTTDSRCHTKYDIEVKDNHNYFVNNILVHNCRAIAYSRNNEVILMSRKGSKIENMGHIEEELKDFFTLFPNMVLDGELYVHGESFQKNMSYVKKYQKGLSERISYWVYDTIIDAPYNQREEILNFTLPNNYKHVKQVPTIAITSEEELKSYHSQFIQEGFEGTMVRWGNEPYKINGRSSHLLKYKDFEDITATIIDVIPAEQRPEWGIPVFDGFKAGTKLSHEERIDLLTNKENYIGKTAELRFFEYTDDGLPRFPVMVGIRLDK